jgi:pyrimidine-nucleoside phosphorylase
MKRALDSGAGLAKFREFVAYQGGEPRFVDNPALLPEATVQHSVSASKGGYLAAMDAEIIGLASVEIGAGRKYKGDRIDPSVGFVLHAKLGDPVRQGQPLVTIHARDVQSANDIRPELLRAFTIQAGPPNVQPVILDVVV